MEPGEAEFKEGVASMDLVDFVTKAAHTRNMVIPDGVRKIDLGMIGEVAEGVLDRTLADPSGLERLREITVSLDRKLRVGEKDSIGRKTEEGQRLEPNYLVPFGHIVAAEVHSHGVDEVPLSPIDLASLFVKTQSPLARSTVFAITVERKMLAFRGEDTPQWEEKAVERKVAHWLKLIYERVEKVEHKVQSQSEMDVLMARVTHAMLRTLSRKYDIRLFSCPSEENVASVESG